MSITYKIVDMERLLPSGVVITATWEATLNKNGETASLRGIAGFDRNDNSPEFISFEDLTEETVLQWVMNIIDTNIVELTLNDRLSSSKTSGMPWQTA